MKALRRARVAGTNCGRLQRPFALAPSYAENGGRLDVREYDMIHFKLAVCGGKAFKTCSDFCLYYLFVLKADYASEYEI